MKIIALVLLFSSSVFAKNLDYSYQQQNSLTWSWAEVISIVAENFSPFQISRCELLSTHYIDQGVARHCCMKPESCEEPYRLFAMTDILKYRFQLAGQWRETISFEKIKTQIDTNRPVVVSFKYQGRESIALIQGYENNRDLHIIDPLESDIVKVSYDDLLRDGYKGIRWFKSYTIGY